MHVCLRYDCRIHVYSTFSGEEICKFEEKNPTTFVFLDKTNSYILTRSNMSYELNRYDMNTHKERKPYIIHKFLTDSDIRCCGISDKWVCFRPDRKSKTNYFIYLFFFH